jgi:hypothetical protein
MTQGVPLCGAVIFAIRQVFEDGGHWILHSIHRQPNTRSQTRAILQGNPGVFDLVNLSGEIIADVSHLNGAMLPTTVRHVNGSTYKRAFKQLSSRRLIWHAPV